MLTAISTAFHKGGWGMWPILFTSVVTIAIIVERAVYLFRASVDKDKLLALLKSQVMSGNVQGAIKVCSGNPTPMTRIVQAGLMKFNKSDEEVQAAMDEAALRELPRINARTPYLAMLANLSVMTGLVGTITGMIKSFRTVGSGDASNKDKMKPDRPVGIFIPHVKVGLPIAETLRQLKPRMTFVSHVLELGHPPKPHNGWRVSYDYAFSTIKEVPPSQATVLTWGERWEWPGTVAR